MNRIERIAIVIESTMDSMLKCESNNPRLDIYLYRYNYWFGMLDRELDKDLTVDVHLMNLTPFMEHIITTYIATEYKREYDRTHYYSRFEDRMVKYL